MKCSLFDCHSNYYYESVCTVISEDEEFEKCFYKKRKRGEMYFLYEKAIKKIINETKKNRFVLSDEEKIEREETKNESEIDSEELDDINIILNKTNCQNMFNKKINKQTKKENTQIELVLPSSKKKNKVYSSFQQIEKKENQNYKKKNKNEIKNKSEIKNKNEIKNQQEIKNQGEDKRKQENGNPFLSSDNENKRNWENGIGNKIEQQEEQRIEQKEQDKDDEMIENFKEDLCMGLNNYFSDIFKKVKKKENQKNSQKGQNIYQNEKQNENENENDKDKNNKKDKDKDKDKEKENLVLEQVFDFNGDNNFSSNSSYQDDIFHSHFLTNTTSLNLENSPQPYVFTEEKNKWNKQNKPNFDLQFMNQELKISYKKKSQQKEEQIKQEKNNPQNKQMKHSADSVNYNSFNTNITNNIVQNNNEQKEQFKCKKATNNPFSSFYMKNSSSNSLKKKKRHTKKKKRKKIVTDHDIYTNTNNTTTTTTNTTTTTTNNNSNNYNYNNTITKTQNKNDDLYLIKSNKKKKKFIPLENQKQYILSYKHDYKQFEKYNETKKRKSKQILDQINIEKKYSSSGNFNKTVENIVRNNEMYNRRNILKKKKISKNMSLNEEKEQTEDFTFIHFQKNQNNKILNKFFL